MPDTILEQGHFISTGANFVLPVPSGADWIEVINETAAYQGAANRDFQFRYFVGMAPTQGIKWTNNSGATVAVAQIAANNGFTIVDTSGNPFGTPVATTSVSNATQPVVLTGNTAGVIVGSVVRLNGSLLTPDMTGFDYSVSAVTANTSFTMAAVLANAPGAGGATPGFYRLVNFDLLFYPRWRTIVNIAGSAGTGTTNAVITVTVPSGYQIGQEIRVNVPSSFYGMTQINQMQGSILAVNDTLGVVAIAPYGNVPALSFVTDINITGFTAFTFPTAAQAATPYAQAQVVPVGMNTATALSAVPQANILTDAEYNTGVVGVLLQGGNTTGGANAGPAGSTGDSMYWIAGRSYHVSTH